MDDGIDNKLDPGEPEERNIYEAMKAGKEVKKLPMSSRRSALEASGEPTKSSSAVCRARCIVSTANTSATSGSVSCHTVTEWDQDTYLDCLP